MTAESSGRSQAAGGGIYRLLEQRKAVNQKAEVKLVTVTRQADTGTDRLTQGRN